MRAAKSKFALGKSRAGTHLGFGESGANFLAARRAARANSCRQETVGQQRLSGIGIRCVAANAICFTGRRRCCGENDDASAYQLGKRPRDSSPGASATPARHMLQAAVAVAATSGAANASVPEYDIAHGRASLWDAIQVPIPAARLSPKFSATKQQPRTLGPGWHNILWLHRRAVRHSDHSRRVTSSHRIH